jgi:hypothetical protein
MPPNIKNRKQPAAAAAATANQKKHPHPQKVAQVNSLASSASHLRKLLKQVQAVDTTPWLVLENYSSIIDMVEKSGDGVVRLKENEYLSPVFNTEDVANSLEVYAGKVCMHVHIVLCVREQCFMYARRASLGYK